MPLPESLRSFVGRLYWTSDHSSFWLRKRVVFCGCAKGFGNAACIQLAQQGARLLLVDVNEEGLRKLEQACKEAGSPKVHTLLLDLSDSNAPATLRQNILSRFDGLDSLFLNHLAGPAPEFFCSNTTKDINTSISINVLVMTQLVRDALPLLIQSNGTLTYTSSASILLPLPTLALYWSSKQFMTTLLESVREELDILGQNMSITTCIVGSVGTESFDTNVGFTARKDKLPIVLSDSMMKGVASMSDAAKFLLKSTAERRRVAYGPQKDIVIGKWVSWVLTALWPSQARALARSVNIIDEKHLELTRKQVRDVDKKEP
ncbi:hypothetical protein HDV00_009288 [Rhizophlyctis rosea]|nr:hypothetical protein HDV00_009288 [Rhizophlyctis rosea]